MAPDAHADPEDRPELPRAIGFEPPAPSWELSSGLSLGRTVDPSESNEDWDELAPKLAAAAPTARVSREELQRALDALDRARPDDAERARLSRDPGLAQVKAILGEGPTSREDRRGTRRLSRGRARDAVDDFTRAIERSPDHPQPWTKRGIARARGRDLEGAVADYTRALELDPGYLPARANRGSAAFHLQRFEAAVDDCGRALEQAPDLAQAWLFRGIARARLGAVDDAQDDLYRFVRLSPYSPFIRLVRLTLTEIADWDERGRGG